jgi:hypothetical protein
MIQRPASDKVDDFMAVDANSFRVAGRACMSVYKQ